MSTGPAGKLGLMMIMETLRRADQAVIQNDIMAMVQIFQEMEECQ